MADRYPNRPQFAAGNSGQQQGDSHDSDPLAELARLIGQTDPQSNFARARQVAREPARAPQSARSLSTDFGASPPSWLRTAQAQAPHTAAHDDPPPDDAYEDEPALSPMPAFLQAAPQPAPSASRYDHVLYGEDQQHETYDQYDDQQGYADENYVDEALENPPAFLHHEKRGSRPGGMLTVVVVAALAVVGTAGAYAYRQYTGAPRAGDPPLIRADNSPSKVVPPTQSGDNSGKLIYDRIGGSAGGTERVVSREEQPVEVNPATPRVVFPSVSNAAQGTVPPQQPQTANAGDDGAADAAPRKIRTVPIRADQSASVAAPVPPKPSPAPTAVRTVPVAGTPPSARSNPLSLTPNAGSSNASASDVRSASASVAPAPATVTRTSGGYLVQIASQKTEAEAEASYRSAQAKFGNLLGSMTPIIKRADLGDKGVYYRAMVGPFSTSEEAGKLCGNLRIAGGSCVVQRN